MDKKLDTTELFALYPRIAVRIRTLWGTKECRELLMSLLNDSRDGTRAGFPVSIGHILISLLNDHDAMFPQFDTKNDSFIPFTAVRPRPVVVQQKHDWGIVGTAAKLIALIFIALILNKVFKIF
jgi:hypothetical protein